MPSRLWSDTGPFTIIPEWLLDSSISDGAVRLYGILGRYTNDEDAAWPSRGLLAKRMSTTTKSVDRRVAELVAVGALQVEHRLADSPTGNRFHRSNIYHLKRVDPRGVGTQLSLGRDSGVSTVATVVSLGGDTSVALNESHELKPIERDARGEKPEAAVLCDRLADLIAVDGCTKPTVTNRWIEEMDRLVRIDGYALGSVSEMIDWVTTDDFWSSNILSPQKLRKHYPRLMKQRKRLDGSVAGGRTDRLLAVLDD